MPSKGSSYTLNCSVPGQGISGLLCGWLFPFSISCFIGAYYVVLFVLGAPVQETSLWFFAQTKSLQILFSGAIEKGKNNASQYAWGGIVYNPSEPPLETQDIWRDDVRDKPITVKEALALDNIFKAGKLVLSNCCVDAHVDCLAPIQAWERQGGKSKQLNDALKELFQTLLAQNISTCLQFVPPPLNQANALSRALSDKDCTLVPEPWKELENLFGPHTFDLMALDSNAQIGCSGSQLPSPF